MTDVTEAPSTDARFRATSVWSDWDSPVVTVVGRIDTDRDADELARQLRHLLVLGARYLLVDFSAVESCNERGQRALIAVRAEARLRQGWLCVLGPPLLLDRLAGFSRQPADGHRAQVAY